MTRHHPSGKPIRGDAKKDTGYCRPFRTGFLNERLNEPQMTFTPHAVGFISPIEPVIYEDDLYAKTRLTVKG